MKPKHKILKLEVPEEVVEMLGEEPERKVLEAMLLHLVQTDRVSVAWAGEKLGMGRQEAVRWYTSHGYPYPDIAPEELEEQFRRAERFRNLHGASRPPK
ncbi:MAG: hypothetical protein H0U65_16275 [Rubrobacter sp.]|jgi:hypothetical protein|nr:hypothetical protein [Rubrobacter sp.]